MKLQTDSSAPKGVMNRVINNIRKYKDAPIGALASMYLLHPNYGVTPNIIRIRAELMELAENRGYKRKSELIKQLEEFEELSNQLQNEDSITPFMDEVIKLSDYLDLISLESIVHGTTNQIFHSKEIH